jgi:hypothetical protein
MSDIVQRLRASVRFGAHNGDSAERAICARQMTEAANEIEDLRRMLERWHTRFAPEVTTDSGSAGESNG